MTTTATTQAVTFPFKFQIPVPEGMSNQLGFPELPTTARLSIGLAGEFTHEHRPSPSPTASNVSR